MMSLSSVGPIMGQATKSKLSSKHHAETEKDAIKPQTSQNKTRYISIPTLAKVLLLIFFLEVPKNEIFDQKECLSNFSPNKKSYSIESQLLSLFVFISLRIGFILSPTVHLRLSLVETGE